MPEMSITAATCSIFASVSQQGLNGKARRRLDGQGRGIPNALGGRKILCFVALQNCIGKTVRLL